jgi:hypothetical protein
MHFSFIHRVLVTHNAQQSRLSKVWAAPGMHAATTVYKRLQTHCQVAPTRRRTADPLRTRVRVAAGRPVAQQSGVRK